jgi:isoleucyl-tRNA synthetase
VRHGNQIEVAMSRREHTLSAEGVVLTMRAPEGYTVEREDAHAVALDLAIDEDLRREGHAREVVHAVQNARRNAGLQVEDRIGLTLSGDPSLLEAARAHSDYLRRETLAVRLEFREGTTAAKPPGGCSQNTEIDGLALTIALQRTERP